MKNNILIAFLFSLLIVGFLVSSKIKFEKKVDTTSGEQKLKTEVSSSPTPLPVTKDNSFTSIDSDLNNTVILNEDFSDLK